MQQLIVILLSAFIALFLADAVISVADDSLILLFDAHWLAGIRGIVFLVTMLMAVVVYVLMGLTPAIPKRLFLPLALFGPLATLGAIPFLIYTYDWNPQVTWGISCCQLVLGLGVLHQAQGGFRFRWPLFASSQLDRLRFSWRNLSVFILANVFGLLPAAAVYSVLCAALALDHFSDGFLTLRPKGLTVQVRKYVRDDGKTIQLVPMSHIGDAGFYRQLSRSFPTNSTILLEGVTDRQNLLTNKITYKRMANSLGLAEQQKEFKPSRGERVRADVDVEVFTTNTIDFLNLIMLMHSKGMNAMNILQVMQYSPPPHFEEQLFDDLLRKRNQHLLEEIQARLSESENIIVPWGAAHMPGLAHEIQKSGFHLGETHDYVAIRFGSAQDQDGRVDGERDDEAVVNTRE